MFRLNTIVYILFFITTAAAAQIKRIQPISDGNQLPIPKVKIYTSDPNSHLKVKRENFNYLPLIKADDQDASAKVKELHDKMLLMKSKPIVWQKEMKGRKSHIGIFDLLRRVHDTLSLNHHVIDSDNYKLPDYYHVTNKLLMEKDTLHYLNGLMTYVQDKGESINKNFRLVKRFECDSTNHGLVYYINKKGINFYGDVCIRYLTIPYTFDNDYLLFRILERRWNCRYTISDIDNFYRIEFKSRDNSYFGFSGYLIVDKTDFGIYEFRAHLSDGSGNIEKSVILQSSTEQTYHVTTTDYYTKFQRDKDGFYRITCSYATKQFEQTQGNFRGKKFFFSSKLEARDNYKNIEFVRFNPYTYELK